MNRCLNRAGLLASLILCAQIAYGQWTRFGLQRKTVTDLAANQIDGSGLAMRSSDFGGTWNFLGPRFGPCEGLAILSQGDGLWVGNVAAQFPMLNFSKFKHERSRLNSTCVIKIAAAVALKIRKLRSCGCFLIE